METITQTVHSPVRRVLDYESKEFLSQKTITIPKIMAEAQSGRFVLQDFKPLADSLEWELSRQYFDEKGSKAFTTAEESVPFKINNDGNLSLNAAKVFFANLEAANEAGHLEPKIYVLEVGCGSGLFARFFLDAFCHICSKHEKDYYHRLCYVATDQSERMLKDIEKNEVLANHWKQFRLVRANSLNLEQDLIEMTESGLLLHGLFRAIFANYLLDNLPASLLEIDEDKVRLLHVKTCLARGVNLHEHTSLDAEEIARMAASTDSDERRNLIDLYPLFALEYDYLDENVENIPYGHFMIDYGRNHESRVLNNHGAIMCVETLLDLLHRDGFIHVNDYEHDTNPDDPAGTFLHQRFSGSIAVGLNFPLLKEYFISQGFQWYEPDEDNDSICSRLIGKNISQSTIENFHSHFDKKAFEMLYQPEKLARTLLQNGATESALHEYSKSLATQPFNWSLMDEVAKFLIFTLEDYQAGLQMAQCGLKLNPNCSASLWNTLGDALFCLEHYDEARDAFVRALEIDPKNVRARFNLVDYFIKIKDYHRTLCVIAEGLLYNKRGEYRERLLHKQGEVLTRLTSREQKEAQFLASRINRCINTS